MLHEKKYILIIIGVIILAATIFNISFVQQSRPKEVIEDKLNIKLPSTSKVLNYTYHKDGGYFDAKISIDKQNINNIKEQLGNSLGGISKNKYPEYINFKNTCSWWDLDIQDIVVSFNSFVSGKKNLLGYSTKTREIWAFISENKEEQYYLYISY